MPPNMISLCCYKSSCSDIRLCMCMLLIPTGYSALALSSCRPASARGLLAPIHYFRAAGDVGLLSEPFSKQTLDSSHVSNVGVNCRRRKQLVLLLFLTEQDISQFIRSAWNLPGAWVQITDESFRFGSNVIT